MRDVRTRVVWTVQHALSKLGERDTPDWQVEAALLTDLRDETVRACRHCQVISYVQRAAPGCRVGLDGNVVHLWLPTRYPRNDYPVVVMLPSRIVRYLRDAGNHVEH